MASLVFNFIDRATLFERYIKTNSPALAISSLFDGPLRSWRRNYTRERFKLGEYAFGIGLAKDAHAQYTTAFQKARQKNANLLSPRDILKRLRERPAMEVKQCYSHGDLHLGNIFVRENSVDTVLIDFRRSGFAPASRDPAELDASLAFAALEADFIDGKTLEALFTPPLIRHHGLSRYANRRALAIQQLRIQISGEVSELEYQIMLALHLLHFARKGNPDAYVCAERVVRTFAP